MRRPNQFCHTGPQFKLDRAAKRLIRKADGRKSYDKADPEPLPADCIGNGKTLRPLWHGRA